jgi:excisionase family DNA binding protein
MPTGSESGLADRISVKVPEPVRLTGLSRSRIYELMRSGHIRFAKVGSSTLILVESLRDYIESRRTAVRDQASAMPRASMAGRPATSSISDENLSAR